MRRLILITCTALALGGCVTDTAPPAAVRPAPPATVEPRHPPAPPRTPLPEPRPADACGAADLQWLVGRPKSEIPVPVEITNRRVLCTTCPATMDFHEKRLNILFDADTGIVKQVRCG